MSLCCDVITGIGCFDSCDAIDTGYDALQTGVHIFEIGLVNSAVKEVSITFTIGDDLILTANTLNEAKTTIIKILQPNGVYYPFTATSTCASITTRVTT